MNLRALACALIVAALLSGCGPKPTVTVYVEQPAAVERAVSVPDSGTDYVLNPASMRFHRPGCAWAEKIAEDRRIEYSGDRQILVDVGYLPCHYCEP